MANNNLKAKHYCDKGKSLFGQIARAGRNGRKERLETKTLKYVRVQQDLIGQQSRTCLAYQDKSQYDVSRICNRCTSNPFNGKYKKHLVYR